MSRRISCWVIATEVLGLLAFLFWLAVLIEALRTPADQFAAADRSKAVGIVVMVVASSFGSVAYF